ncbi:MAG: NAD(P)/FAD-dependent oxidoreductase [Prevotella sp.]|nr:NAD(P)/FAD-dependent oxidoreductase [Candidatus Prevotella equi]
MHRKKVVIIGSGWGGLTSAYILQRNGYDVTVLEQGVQPGGCLQCFTRKGAKFETGMHFIGSADEGQTMHHMMRYLNIHDKIRLDRLDTDGYDTIAFGNERYKIPNGVEPFVEKLSQHFPKETDNLRKYWDIINSIAGASTLKSLTSEERDLSASTEYQLLSMDEVLDGLFKDETLKNVLAGSIPLYSAEQGKTPFSQHAFIMDFYNQSAFRTVGGSDQIATELIKNIQNIGGRVVTKAKAMTIDCDGPVAKGVITEDETYYPADYVISTPHPMRTLEMLRDASAIRPAFRNRIQSLKQTAATFAVYITFKENTVPYMNTNYYGYSGNTPWNCEHYTEENWPKGFLYMHMCHEDKPQYAKSAVVLSYMDMKDVEQWQNTTVEHRGEDYKVFKQRHAEKLLQTLQQHFPGIQQSIQAYYTSTPLTYLDYTGTQDGSMYGIAKDVTLGVAGRVPYRTKIKNLYLAGQNVNSHGILGVLVGTIVTCSEIVPPAVIYQQIKESNE